MIAEGDKVWARVATSGGHTGEWKGIAPTGRRWTNTGVIFLRIANGRVAEWSGQFDVLNHFDAVRRHPSRRRRPLRSDTPGGCERLIASRVATPERRHSHELSTRGRLGTGF